MISIKHEDGLYIPTVYCDVCYKQIDDIGLAGVVHENWLEDDKENIGVKFAHKGRCMASAEQMIKINNKKSGWQELTSFMDDLNFNLNLNLKK